MITLKAHNEEMARLRAEYGHRHMAGVKCECGKEMLFLANSVIAGAVYCEIPACRKTGIKQPRPIDTRVTERVKP